MIPCRNLEPLPSTYLLYKHSPRCCVSTHAYSVVEMAALSIHIPVYIIDVIYDKDISMHYASVLDVPHKSPQLIIVHDGIIIAHTSHQAIT